MSNYLAAGSYFGTCGATCSCSHAAVTRVTHAHARRLPEHGHERAYISLLIAGSYSERIHGMEYRYRPMDAVFHPSGALHSDAIGDGGASFLCAELVESDPDGLIPRARLMPHVLRADATLAMIRLDRHLRQGTLCTAVLESATFELVGLLGKPEWLISRRCPAWMHDCLDCLDEDYPGPITVKGLAQTVGVHPVHLAREFRRRIGATVGEYVNRLRVRAACRRMLSESGTLAEIAAATGFYDQSHFVRVFRAELGCPPSAFRRGQHGEKLQAAASTDLRRFRRGVAAIPRARLNRTLQRGAATEAQRN